MSRLRGLLVHIHPSPEKSLGDNVSHEAVLCLLVKSGGPAGLRALGRARIDRELAKHAPRIHGRLADEIWYGLAAQTVVPRHHRGRKGPARDREPNPAAPRPTKAGRQRRREGPRCPPPYRSPDAVAGLFGRVLEVDVVAALEDGQGIVEVLRGGEVVQGQASRAAAEVVNPGQTGRV